MANEGRRRFQRAWQNELGKKADKPKLVPAMVGAYFNGQKTIKVSGREDFIWARIRGKTSEVVQVFNDIIQPFWDLPILVYRDPNYPDIWKVYGRDISRYEDWGGVSYIPSHGSQHAFAHGDNVGADVVWVFKRQFVPMLLRPGATATMSVYGEADFYYFDGSYTWFPGTGTEDLTSYKPTGGHNAKYATIYIEPSTNNLLVLEGPEFDAIWPPDDPGDMIAVPSPHVGIPLGAVLLMTGTNQIGWGELYDLRNIVSALPITGGFTEDDIVWPYDNIGVYHLDDGTPLGTGTWIDWGAYSDVSLSGTVLRVDYQIPTGTIDVYEDSVFGAEIAGINFTDNIDVSISGSIAHVGVPVAAIEVYDSGTYKADATRIDFQSNLNVSVSGTIVYVDGQAGGGGGGALGVMGWDDGVPIGTGTYIDFGDYLNATISGTVLRVDNLPDTEVWDDSIYITGAVSGISFDAGLDVAATGSVVFVGSGAPTLYYCEVICDTTNSFVNEYTIVFTSAPTDPEGMWTSGSAVYVPYAGYATVTATTGINAAGGSGDWRALLYHNGSIRARHGDHSSDWNVNNGGLLCSLAYSGVVSANDYFQLGISNYSGSGKSRNTLTRMQVLLFAT